MQKPKKSYILLDSGRCLIWDNTVPSVGSPLVLQPQQVDASECREILSADLCNYTVSTYEMGKKHKLFSERNNNADNLSKKILDLQ